MTLDMEVGLSAGDIVLDEDQALPKKRHSSSPLSPLKNVYGMKIW